MEKKQIIGALIGLSGAVGNSGRDEVTDRVVRMALLSLPSEEILSMIHREKHRLSPDCASCQSPCGNTSDFDMSQIEQNSPEIKALKQQVMTALVQLVSRCKGRLPDAAYRALQYLKYELAEESYHELLAEMNSEG